MAKEAMTGNEENVEPVKRKRRAPEGPRKIKPVHAAVEVMDANGNPVEGAQVKVHKASKDFETIYSHLEQNPTHSRVRIPLDNLAD